MDNVELDAACHGLVLEATGRLNPAVHPFLLGRINSRTLAGSSEETVEIREIVQKPKRVIMNAMDVLPLSFCMYSK